VIHNIALSSTAAAKLIAGGNWIVRIVIIEYFIVTWE